MWLNKFKIAIVSKDTEGISELLNNRPDFSDVSKMKEAMHLIKEASSLLQELKNDTSISMKQIKKNIDFLKVTQLNQSSKLDVTS